VLDKSALYGGSQEVFAAGMAACGCHARSKKDPAAAGGEGRDYPRASITPSNGGKKDPSRRRRRGVLKSYS